MLDRRHFIAASCAAAAGALATRAGALAPGPGLTSLLDGAMNQVLLNSPQLMTFMGLDVGNHAHARHRLDDRSASGLSKMRSIFEQLGRDLTQFRPESLTGGDIINYRTADFLVGTILQSYKFHFGEPGFVAVPYVLSQLNGSYRSTPSFLANQHPIGSLEDAEAYLDRLAALDIALDQETDRALHDISNGASPPDFVLRRTIEQLEGLLAPSPVESEMVSALVRRTAAKGLRGNWEARASRIVEGEVYPALRRQLDSLQKSLGSAPREAGCWRLPEGEDYYRYAVRSFTTTDMPGPEIHSLGLELVRKLTSQADSMLKSQGLTKGSVAERLAALRRDPRQLYPDNDEGRARLLNDLNKMSATMRARLPDYFATLPTAPVVIQRVPPTIEAGAPGGYYEVPTIDGKRPGIFYINLRDMAELAKFDQPTLVWHEVVPGHHLQNALNVEATGIPLMRRLPLFSSFSEGWALYAEQLADEMGVYADDPLGRLGYIASFLFRAARLVMDSGLHHQRWSREKTIRYMMDTLGEAETTATTEVERYCVQPGQASSYMLGYQVWMRARDNARKQLGSHFDLRFFHDAGLLAGSMPLAVLEGHLSDWAKSR